MTADPFATALDARIAAAVAARIEELQRPSHVTQRSVLSLVGMPAGTFLEAARAGEFASYKVQRLVFAKLEDVLAYIEAHPVRRSLSANDAEPTASSEAKMLGRAGFRRVG
jgi:hypothetical protein